MSENLDYKEKFRQWFLNFRTSSLFEDMLATIEASSWHKEENVGVHTKMVVGQYIRRSPIEWDKKDFLGAVQCAFHDTGKKMAEEYVTRGEMTYKRYSGHELYSARLFVNYVYSDKILLELLDDVDIYNIAVMMQSHIPYQLRKEKLGHLKTHLAAFGLEDIFLRCLESDTYGRISEDQESKRDNFHKWVTEKYQSNIVGSEPSKAPNVILMCAPTGAGKSTLVKCLLHKHANLGQKIAVHSLDQCRLDWYSANYQEAFEKAQEDKTFANRAIQDFCQKCKENDIVIVDNTNISSKARRRYGSRKNVHAVVILLSYDANFSRGQGRTDKRIPKHVLDSMYWNFKLPILGEVDTISLSSERSQELRSLVNDFKKHDG